jgi:trehalose synthase
VGSVEECAEKMLRLLQNPEEGEELALWGKETVREHFLLPRLIADELALYASLFKTRAAGAGVTETRGGDIHNLER